MPSDTTRPGYLKAQMAAEKHGGYTTFIDLPEAVMLDNLRIMGTLILRSDRIYQ